MSVLRSFELSERSVRSKERADSQAASMACWADRENSSIVLETAAGSGVVTRALASRLGAGARYVVTDLNQPHARLRRHPAGRRRQWQQADALKLPFEDA